MGLLFAKALAHGHIDDKGSDKREVFLLASGKQACCCTPPRRLSTTSMATTIECKRSEQELRLEIELNGYGRMCTYPCVTASSGGGDRKGMTEIMAGSAAAEKMAKC